VHRLDDLLPDGVARRESVTKRTSSSSVGRWLARGDLVLLAPGVLAVPTRTQEWAVRAHAATLYAGGPLSHLSALVGVGLAARTTGPVHVTVLPDRCPRDAAGVTVHRSRRRLVTIRCDRVEAIEPTRSLVDAWAWAWSPARNPHAVAERPVIRQAVIEAIRTRVVHAAALQRECDRRGRHAGRRELRALLALVAGGCQSELEIWGVLRVLRIPGLPTPVQQHPVELADGKWVHLDAAFPGAMVAVELDGAAFHGSREARERDLRRDSALAAAGWIVLRFSYHRLVNDPEGCRREIEAAVRRRMAHG
jgi:very-short-patch-repair endonuclease